MRLEIIVLYYNILKVSQVFIFLTLGYYSFPFYKRIKKALRLIYEIIKYITYNLYSGLFHYPRVFIALLYFTKGIKVNTSLAKYYYAAVNNTFILKKSARGPRVNIIGAIPRAGPSFRG